MKTDLLKLIIRMVNFPESTVCRHAVALDLLNLLEKHDMLPKADVAVLAKCLCDGCEGDSLALSALKQLM
jgi:hypothetical protein